MCHYLRLRLLFTWVGFLFRSIPECGFVLAGTCVTLLHLPVLPAGKASAISMSSLRVLATELEDPGKDIHVENSSV